MSYTKEQAVGVLKELLNANYSLCDTMDQNPDLHISDKISLRDVLRVELIKFIMYLSASDGRVSWEESKFYERVFGGAITTSEMTRIIKDNDIYSVSFEIEVPIILKVYVNADNLMMNAEKKLDNPCSHLLIDLYEKFGKVFCLFDGDFSDNENQDLDIYLNTLKSYVSRELKKPSIIGISKKSQAPANSLKSKYEFLKKLINEDSVFLTNYCTEPEGFLDTVLYIETNKGSGTGFVFNDAGYAITCAHVVKDASEIYVRIGRDPEAIERAKVLVTDTRIDLAILEVEGLVFNCAELEVEKPAQLGKDIIILGFPFGAKMADDVSEMSVSFTRGYISSLQTRNGRKEALLDISAKAGNSGSPVVDVASGKVIGVLSGSILGGMNNREEVNYMIPISYILDLLED